LGTNVPGEDDEDRPDWDLLDVPNKPIFGFAGSVLESVLADRDQVPPPSDCGVDLALCLRHGTADLAGQVPAELRRILFEQL
jgi:hypothetical protein